MLIRAKNSAAMPQTALAGTVTIGSCCALRYGWMFRRYLSKLKISVKRAIVWGLAATTIAGSVALAGTGALAAGSQPCTWYGLCDHSAQGYVGSYSSEAVALRRHDLIETDGLSAPHGHYGWDYFYNATY
jgi:hypothetical protein